MNIMNAIANKRNEATSQAFLKGQKLNINIILNNLLLDNSIIKIINN